MSYVRIEGLTKQFKAKPPTVANDDLDLEIEHGEFVVLLGPSGCGKTTTLRCLAGLETPDTGRISFGDRTVFDAAARTNLSPDKRNIGMVFQSYALWPHMTVRKNIGYPLRTRRVNKEQAKQWIEETADLVDCGHLLDRFPGQLSGGQQQRVALARGLPLMRPTIGAASALMFVLLTHEFAASLLVRSPTTQVMGTILFDYWINGSYPLVAAIALTMSLVTAAGVAIAVIVAGSDVFSKL